MSNPHRKSENSIISEIQMLTDGLDGLIIRFMEYNKSNTKLFSIMKNIATTSFKLGALLQEKKNLDM